MDMLGTTPTKVGTTPTMLGTTPTKVGTTPTMVGTTPTMVGTTPTCARRKDHCCSPFPIHRSNTNPQVLESGVPLAVAGNMTMAESTRLDSGDRLAIGQCQWRRQVQSRPVACPRTACRTVHLMRG